MLFCCLGIPMISFLRKGGRAMLWTCLGNRPTGGRPSEALNLSSWCMVCSHPNSVNWCKSSCIGFATGWLPQRASASDAGCCGQWMSTICTVEVGLSYHSSSLFPSAARMLHLQGIRAVSRARKTRSPMKENWTWDWHVWRVLIFFWELDKVVIQRRTL